MGAYVVWFPHHRIRVLVFRFITQMPALMVIGLWIVFQVWAGVGSIGRLGEVGGVAYLAHIGGAATGIVVASIFHDRVRLFRAEAAARDGWFEGPLIADPLAPIPDAVPCRTPSRTSTSEGRRPQSPRTLPLFPQFIGYS